MESLKKMPILLAIIAWYSFCWDHENFTFKVAYRQRQVPFSQVLLYLVSLLRLPFLVKQEIHFEF